MKRAAALILLGLLVPVIQGAVAVFLPRAACPDMGLLLVIALGICLPGTAGGLALAAWCGFVADLLSGSLLGQHALLWLLAFGVARLTSLHVNLQGPFTQMALAAGLSLGCAFGIFGLTAFFAPDVASLASASELLRQTAVNGLLAPVGVGLSARLIAKLGDDDRRVLRLEPRSYST